MVSSSANVDNSNLFSQPHANIFNLINNRSNIADPEDSSGARRFVYVRMPRVNATSFPGYPFIIIPPIQTNQDGRVVDASKADTVFTLNIVVMTVDQVNQSSVTPSGANQLDTISNSILQILNASRTTLRNQGMKHFQLTSSEADIDEIDNQNVFVREFELTFSQLTKVVS